MKLKKINNLGYLNELTGYVTEKGTVIIQTKSQYDWCKAKFWLGYKSLLHYHEGNSFCTYKTRKEVLNSF
jgi:GH43 family beta-xylosidase